MEFAGGDKQSYEDANTPWPPLCDLPAKRAARHLDVRSPHGRVASQQQLFDLALQAAVLCREVHHRSAHLALHAEPHLRGNPISEDYIFSGGICCSNYYATLAR